MALKYYKPTTPGQRQLVLVDRSELHKGAPVKAVGVALQVSPMSVMGLAEKNIKTPKDIIGVMPY